MHLADSTTFLSVQSNHFNTDTEGVIESVHIRSFLSQVTKQTVQNNEVFVLSGSPYRHVLKPRR